MADKTLVNTHRVWAYVSDEVYKDMQELARKSAVPPTKVASMAIVAGIQTLKTSLMPEKYLPAIIKAAQDKR